MLGEAPGRASVRRGRPKVAALGGVPAHEGDPLPVGGEGGLIHPAEPLHQGPGLAVGKLHGPELVQRSEGDARAVGAGLSVPDVPHREGVVPVRHLLLDQGAQGLLHPGGEGDVADLVGPDVHFVEGAAGVVDQRVTVGGEVEARAVVEVLPVDGEDQPPVGLGRQVTDTDAAHGVHVGDVRHPLAVGGDGRARAARRDGGDGGHVPGGAVEPHDLGTLGQAVAPEAHGAPVGDAAEVHVPALGAPAEVAPLGLLRHAHPGAPVQVDEPRLAAAVALAGTSHHDVRPVG